MCPYEGGLAAERRYDVLGHIAPSFSPANLGLINDSWEVGYQSGRRLSFRDPVSIGDFRGPVKPHVITDPHLLGRAMELLAVWETPRHFGSRLGWGVFSRRTPKGCYPQHPMVTVLDMHRRFSMDVHALKREKQQGGRGGIVLDGEDHGA